MEWNNPRVYQLPKQSTLPQQAHGSTHPCSYYDEEEDSSELQRGNATLSYDQCAGRRALPLPLSIPPLKTEYSSEVANNGQGAVQLQSLSSLCMPQLEETTEFQPFYSLQGGGGYTDSAFPTQDQPPLLQQQQDEPQSDQLPSPFSAQYPLFPSGLPTYFLPSTPPSMLPPHSPARPSLNYFSEGNGIPTLHSVNSPVLTLPSSFASLHQQQHHSQPEFEDCDDEFDIGMARDSLSTTFNSLLPMTPTNTATNSRKALVFPMGNYPGFPTSTLSTTPEYTPTTPEGRARRDTELSEPFTRMTTAPEPKFSPDRRKLCCVEGCKSQARAFNRCKRHGGSKRCSTPGCTKSVQSLGLCIRHGGGSRCQQSGCTRASQSHGRCKMHGGGRPCVVVGCEKKAHLKRLCRRHGGGAKCCVTGCDKWAQRQGMCMMHSKVVALESIGIDGIGESAYFEQNSPPTLAAPELTPLSSLELVTDEV